MLYIPYPFKRCLQCGLEYPRTKLYFARNSRAKDGLGHWCKKCQKEWALAHPQNKKTTARKYYQNHRVQIKDHVREYRLTHPDNVKQSMQKTTAKHRERRNKGRLQYYYAHRDLARKQANNYYVKHSDKIKTRVTRYNKLHPEKARAWSHTRRALRRNACGSHSADDVQSQLKRQKKRCYYCGDKLKGKEYHVDHVVPLSRGGSNSPDNLVIACPICNLKKHNKMPHEWPEGGRLL